MYAPDRSRLALIERAFAAIGRADADGAVECYTDDYVLEAPFAQPAPKLVVGCEAVREYLRGVLGIFRFELSITAVYPTIDPDLLVLEYTCDGHVTTTGKPYANRYVGIVTFRGDRIASLREYFDPTAAARALEP